MTFMEASAYHLENMEYHEIATTDCEIVYIPYNQIFTRTVLRLHMKRK